MSEQNGGRPLRVLGVGDGHSLIFLRWAWRVAELGHDVHIVSDRLSVRPGELDGITAHKIQDLELRTRIKGLRKTRFAPAIRNLAERLDVDVVHAHYLLPYGYWAAEAGVHPLVMSPWNTDIFTYGRDTPQGVARVARGGRGRRRLRRELDRKRRRDRPPRARIPSGCTGSSGTSICAHSARSTGCRAWRRGSAGPTTRS